jgi:serine/threonine-protein kinase
VSTRTVPVDVLDWIDDIADQFESAWKGESPPSIADFLGPAAGDRRHWLLQELVKIDLEYRWEAGDRRRLEDYVKDYPDSLGPGGTLPDQLVFLAREVRDRFTPPRERLSPVNAPTEVELRCPQCGNRVDKPQGRHVTCAACGNSFRLATDSAWGSNDLPRTLGRFQLLEQLGRGSFGTVYKARDAELGRLVAVKVPRAGSFATAQEEERFLGEARSAARLQHPHIVPVHEIAHEGDMPYIVSDYVEGRTLAELLMERRPGFRESAALAAQIADALDYAHDRKVIHRDVKPANILLVSGGSSPDIPPQPKLTDFGLARREEGALVVTREGEVLGTPAYMAPEQAAGEQAKVDGRSDVYSLGAVLYELLTGEPPFRGTLRMVLYQVMHEEPRAPRKLNDHILATWKRFA